MVCIQYILAVALNFSFQHKGQSNEAAILHIYVEYPTILSPGPVVTIWQTHIYLIL